MTEKLIDRNPDILGGTPVFSGTRVPVRILMEHLEAGDRLDDFLDDYPTVTREQAVELLERATAQLLGDARSRDLTSIIRSCFGPDNGVDLELPERDPARDPPSFE